MKAVIVAAGALLTVANADALGITYVIFDRRIWSTARSTEGWRRYNGGGIYDPTTAAGHYDHVHISVRVEAK